jgi:RNA polymerase sigma-70 factor (ECF subfamily)
MPAPTRIDGATLLANAGFVRAMARGVLGADDRVDDVVQDTFVAALSRERPPSRWSSWLGSVGKRRALDVRRKDARRGVHERRAARLEASSGSEELRGRAEVTRRLIDALLTLDEPYRDALLLRYWEDLPPRDIAARLGVPVETVRTRIRRAHEQLRAKMDESDGGRREGWAAVLAQWAGGDRPATAGGGGVLLRLLARPALAVPAVVGLAVAGVVTFATLSQEGVLPSVADGGIASRRGEPADPSGASLGVASGTTALAQNASNDDGVPPTDIEVKGSVRDRAGAPVVGIQVAWSLAPSDPAVNRPEPVAVYTDAQGRYAVPGLPAGRLSISIPSEKYVGPPLEVEHDLRGAWSHDFVVVGDIVLAGEVVGATPPTFDLWLVRKEKHHAAFDGPVSVARRASLGSSGRSFRFTALAPGLYDIGLSGAGLAKVYRTIGVFDDVTDLRFEAPSAHRVAGRVLVSPRLGPGRTDVRVCVEARFCDVVKCADDGSFAVEGVPAGPMSVDVWHSGQRTVGGETYGVFTTRARALSVPLAVDPLEIPMEPDEDVGLRVRPPEGVRAVSGLVDVVDGAGAGVGPQAFLAEVRNGRLDMQSTRMETIWPPVLHSTPDGAFLVKGCARGRCVLRVTAPGFAPVDRELWVEGPTTVEVDLVPAKGREVRASFVDRWWAVDARRAGSSDRWDRILWQDARIVPSHTEPAGVTSLTLPAGEWEFRATTRAHAPAFLGPVTVKPDTEPLVLEFASPAGASISGRLRTAADLSADLLLFVFRRDDAAGGGGRRSPGAGPTYARLEGKETRSEGGAYRFDGLAPGRYRVSPSIEGTPVVGEVEVADDDVTLDLTLSH